VKLVLDASVVVKWFVQEDGTEAAIRLVDHAPDLVAPDLSRLEVANTLWRKFRRREIDRIDVEDSLQTLERGVPKLVPTADHVAAAQAIMLDLDHPIYDCLYLALAEAADAKLVTDDRRLQMRTAGTRFAARVQWLDR